MHVRRIGMDMTYRKISNGFLLAIIACALPVYFLLSHYNQEGRGFVAALSICGILSLISILRDISHNAKFWVGISLIAIVHAALVILVPWGDHITFGIFATPFVIADMYVSARLLIAFCGESHQ
jgi:hypothetical protein